MDSVITSPPLKLELDENIQARAETVFAQLGLTSLEAIQSFYIYVANKQSLPFALRRPNAETMEAIENFHDGAKRYKVTSFAGLHDMLADEITC